MATSVQAGSGAAGAKIKGAHRRKKPYGGVAQEVKAVSATLPRITQPGLAATARTSFANRSHDARQPSAAGLGACAQKPRPASRASRCASSNRSTYLTFGGFVVTDANPPLRIT
jgi:hypothetical protein